ncbi:MAG: amylo-alpha-1,6-glucosidase, partial [Chloroflexi bacterium]
MPVTVGPSSLTINHDRQFLISQPNATMLPQDDVGFYARDTRFVSGYSVTINGLKPLLLDAITVEHFSARHEFMTPELRLGSGTGDGADGVLPERSVGFRLERTILEGVHEDYDLTNYAMHPVRLVLEIGIESDFADIFDVRSHRLIRRGDLQTVWRPRAGELRSTYRNRTFRRGLIVKVEKAGSKAEYANGRLVFVCELLPGAEWHVCLKWLPVIGPRPARTLPCHSLLLGDSRVAHPLPPVELVTSHPTLPAIWEQAVEDTEALRMVDTTVRGGVFVPAAGIPWFVTVFGRDSLVVSMESISAFPEFALGALRTLAQVQATDDDAEQDKEPGKILHEIRSGELASLKLLPFAPYYGTADATP